MQTSWNEMTPEMESALRECLSYDSSTYGYRFRQATMRKCQAAGLAEPRPGDPPRKRPAWVVTIRGIERLREYSTEVRSNRDRQQMSTERDIDRDAARYRWLRERLEVRKLRAVSGSVRPGLEVRLGCEFFDVAQRERNRRPALAEIFGDYDDE